MGAQPQSAYTQKNQTQRNSNILSLYLKITQALKLKGTQILKLKGTQALEWKGTQALEVKETQADLKIKILQVLKI